MTTQHAIDLYKLYPILDDINDFSLHDIVQAFRDSSTSKVLTTSEFLSQLSDLSAWSKTESLLWHTINVVYNVTLRYHMTSTDPNADTSHLEQQFNELWDKYCISINEFNNQ